MCGDSHLAEEITQDTFIKALKNINTFEGKCKLSVWLCQIAKNTFYTYKRKQSITARWVQEENSLVLDETIDLLIVKENSLQIHKVLHQLKEPYKEVFMLRVFGELSFFQISEIFEKTESWSRVTFYRAKQIIQLKLKEVNQNE